MRCPICRTGETEPGTATFTYDKNGCVVVIRHVPAEVCKQCREPFYGEEIVDELLELVGRASSAKLEVAIQDYADRLAS